MSDIVYPTPPWRDYEVKVLVPHGRETWEVRVNGERCRKMTTETPPGFGYNVETWGTPSLPGPPIEIITKLTGVE